MVGFLDQYQIFFNKAKTDFTAAQLLYAEFENGNSELDLDIIYFHLQQCVEKLFKALLSQNNINPPRVHDLEVLLNLLLDAGIDIQIDEELMLELNDFAVEGRYAVIHDDIDNVPAYFGILQDLMEFVRKSIEVRKL